MWPVWREVFAQRWQGWFSLKPNCVALVEGRVSIYMGCNGQGWFGAVFLEATLARWDLCCSMLVVERVYNLAISPHTTPPPPPGPKKKTKRSIVDNAMREHGGGKNWTIPSGLKRDLQSLSTHHMVAQICYHI